jgi:hypothetical protein
VAGKIHAMDCRGLFARDLLRRPPAVLAEPTDAVVQGKRCSFGFYSCKSYVDAFRHDAWPEVSERLRSITPRRGRAYVVMVSQGAYHGCVSIPAPSVRIVGAAHSEVVKAQVAR